MSYTSGNEVTVGLCPAANVLAPPGMMLRSSASAVSHVEGKLVCVNLDNIS